jgi:hypothetical protein
MQLRHHDRFGTEVPNELGILFRREGTLVPLARKKWSLKLKGQSIAPINE